MLAEGDNSRAFRHPRHKSELKSGFIVMEMWQVGSFEAPVMGPLQSESHPFCPIPPIPPPPPPLLEQQLIPKPARSSVVHMLRRTSGPHCVNTRLDGLFSKWLKTWRLTPLLFPGLNCSRLVLTCQYAREAR